MFFKSRIFIATVLLQLAGPLIFTMGNWANIIQYLSGFGMAYALWEYFAVHKPQIDHFTSQLAHLHEKHDDLHDFIKGGTNV